MKCRLNNPSASKGDRTIPYDGVALGDYTLVEPNFMMKVGSDDEGSDLGKIRIRSADASQFIVSENSNVQWQDDAYLTIYRFVELNPIYPRIIQNPSNDEDVIFYKDWDIPYSNQNSILGTFPCAGPDRALFKGEQTYYSSTGTVNLVGDALSFEWFFEGGTPTGSTSRDPGYVTYNTPGHYITRLMVSGSSGSNDIAYRCVSVYDKPGDGLSTPVKRWELLSLGGSRDEGGYQASFRVYDNIPIEENSVVVLFADDWYGNTNQSLGGNSPGNEKIFFVGRVLDGTVHYDYKKSYIEFTVSSITELMKNALSFSVSVESKLSPSTWYELYDMDCRRAIYHYLRWHSTALILADFQFLGDDYKIQYFDADRTSMFDAIDNLMRNTLLGKVVSDRQGKVWIEVDARAHCPYPVDFVYPPIMYLTKRDWMGEPSIEERRSDALSYYEAGGIAYSGVHTGTFSAILASAPGSTPSFRGRIEMPEGLALLGQDQLNQLVGNIFANENSPYPKITVDLAGNYRNIDIAPQESVRMAIEESDTVARIAINDYYVPDSIEWRYDPKKKSLLAGSVSFINVIDGTPGEMVEIAADASDTGGYDIPSLSIPPIPPLTIPPMLAGLITGTFSQSMVNNSIENYEADYYSYVWYNNAVRKWDNRGIAIETLGGVTDDSDLAEIGVTVSKSGVYSIAARAHVYRAESEISLSVVGEMYLDASIGNLAQDTDSNFYSNHLNVSIPLVVHLNAGQIVRFLYYALGAVTGIHLTLFSFGIVRISK
jgi:hypothetical protein